eukprot:GHVN01057048.1.p1 GENE.GHVN01057048.1~~GHVN01057048.1.p1  ORF type:complete len:103 (-),score=8.89 GHVN01057048.1:115-423(-)
MCTQQDRRGRHSRTHPPKMPKVVRHEEEFAWNFEVRSKKRKDFRLAGTGQLRSKGNGHTSVVTGLSVERAQRRSNSACYTFLTCVCLSVCLSICRLACLRAS